MNEPIRVLQVFAEMNRGGAETMIMNLYRHIDREKIQFDFIVHTQEKCAFDEEIEQLGGRIHRVPKYVGKNHFEYKDAWQKFFLIHPEYKIVHGHVRSTASIYLKIAKKRELVTIAHSHSTSSRGNVLNKIVKKVLQYNIRNIADYLFSCSNDASVWLFGKEALSRKNHYIIKNAINLNEFSYNEVVRKELREKYSIQEQYVVGHVGSFTHPKNHTFLIDIFCNINMVNKNSVLVLIGDGPLRKTIEDKVRDLNLSNKVLFVGSTPKVSDFLQLIDIFVFPSLYEGLPVSLIEVQAAGLNALVSDKITSEVNVSSELYYYSLDNSPDMWANKALELCGKKRNGESQDKLRNAGYDINHLKLWYRDFIINGVNNA